MKELSKGNISRRDFITLGWSRTREQEGSNGFRVDVVEPDELPEDLPGIIFSNWIDFPSKPEPTPAGVMTASWKGNLASPIWVEPATPLRITKEEKALEMVAFAGEWWGPWAPVALGSWMLYQSEKIPKPTRRHLLQAMGVLFVTFGFSKLGIIRATAKQERGPDVFASEFSMRARVSSMRSMIFMKDVWELHKEDLGEEPVLAISESKADALELFVHQDPERLKTQLSRLPEYRGTLIESAREAGSVEKLFTYNIADLFGNFISSVTIRDKAFLRNLKGFIDPHLPKPLREGEMQA